MYTQDTLFEDLPDYIKEKYYKDQHIQLFYKNKLVTDIIIANKHIAYKKYGNKFDSLFVSDEPIDFEYIYAIFTTRVIKNCDDKPTKQWLKYYNLKEYDVYELMRVMHGIRFEDSYYFLFDNEINNKNISIEKIRKYATPTVKEFENVIGEKICFH